MPKRTREHELETESRKAFEDAVPSAFVVRPIERDDYGIDAEVEVFRDGLTTGLMFKVQLKGTDKSGRSIRLKREHIEYWRGLDVPVLIVVYEAKTRALRSVWAHAVGVEKQLSTATKVTVAMDPDWDLVEGWADDLSRDLTVVRELRRGEVPRPLPVRFKIDPNVVDPDDLAVAVQRLSRRGPWAMRIAAESEPAVLLEVTNRRLRAVLPMKWASMNLKATDDLLEDPGVEPLAELLILQTAAAHASVNEKAAALLAQGTSPDCPLWAVEEFGSRLGPALVAEEQLDYLFDVMGALAQTPTPEGDQALEWYQSILFGHLHLVDEDRFAEFSAQRRQALASLAAHSPADAGRQLFNLAHIHKGRRDWETAVQLFREAATLQPQYATDPMALSHLAGALWFVEDYAASAAAYDESIEHGGREQILGPLMADSLMLAGRYQEAREVLARWEPADEERDRVGLIRIAILDHVEAVVGVDAQDRTAYDVEAHLAKLESIDARGTDGRASVVDLLRSEDALSPSAWSALIDPDDPSQAFLPGLIVAATAVHFVPAWALTLLWAIEGEAPAALQWAIANEARLTCGDDFYDFASMVIQAEENPTTRVRLRRLVNETYGRDPVSHGHTFRLVNGDADTDWVVESAWVGRPGAVPPDEIPGMTTLNAVD